MSDIVDISKNSWDPSFYSANSEVQYIFAKKNLEKFPFKGNEQVLDIGCGPGIITAQIAQLLPNGRVLGMDFSPQMISFANKAFNEIPNLSFKQADVRYFNFDQQFDLITSFSSLHWVIEQQTALNQINSHLKPGGFFLLYMSGPAIENSPLTKAGTFMIHHKGWNQYFETFTIYDYLLEMRKERYNQLLIKANFKVLQFEEKLESYTFLNVVDFANWLKGWSPLGFVIPLERKNEFFATMAHRFLHESQQKTNNIVYKFYSWSIFATK